MSFHVIKAMVLMMVFVMTSLFAMPSQATGYDVVVNATPVTVSKSSLMNHDGDGGSSSTINQVLVGEVPMVLASHVHGIGCGHSLIQLTCYNCHSTWTKKVRNSLYRNSHLNQQYSKYNDKVPWVNF